MLTTNCSFLENELLDAARLFKNRPQNITHAFRFDMGVFVSSVNGKFDTLGFKFTFELFND